MAKKKPLKQKECKAPNCINKFTPRTSFQTWCCPDCAIEIYKARKAETDRKDLAKRRKEFKENDRSYMLKAAQHAFNGYIRERDRDEPCISCGKPEGNGIFQAGHYRTVGAMPALRFNEDNVHKQCAPCNNYKSGNITEYRLNLVNKIGEERLAFIEGPHEPQKLSLDEIKEIKEKYQRKKKELIDSRK